MSTFVVQQSGVISGGGTALGTYTPRQAVELVREFMHGIPVQNVEARACDAVNAKIWRSYTWRWSVKATTSFSLVEGQQDYQNVPTDILRLCEARVVRTDVTPNTSRELFIKQYISPESLSLSYGTLNTLSFEPSTNVFRIGGPFATGGLSFQIQGIYQFLPPRISDADMDTIFYFPDVYFDVFVEGLKWKFYQLADDARAGGVTNSNGRTVYTGQLAVFMDALDQMKRQEDYSDGEAAIWPEEPLGGRVGIISDGFVGGGSTGFGGGGYGS